MKKSFLFLPLIMALSFPGCTRSGRGPSPGIAPAQHQLILDTICSITLYEWGTPQVYEEIFSRIREIESRMSLFIEGSYVDRINQAAGIEAVQVSPDVFYVIERAVHYAEISGGAFDPSIGPLVSLWGIGGDNERVPAQEEINQVLGLINWQDIELNREDQTVFLRRPGMALDLGAIAKGYAADEAAAIIKRAEIPQAIIDLGGNVVLVGDKLDGTPWRIGVQDPLENRGSFFGILETSPKTVVTSGLYERFFVHEEVHYHHIFSSVTGYPAQNDLLGVSIITGNSMDADAISTATFVLGYEAGRAFIESLEGVDAIFILNDQSIRLTGDSNLILTNTSYRLVN